MNGYSAHADRDDLLAYIRTITPHPRIVCVVHGEERQSLAFAMKLTTEFPGMEVKVHRPDSTGTREDNSYVPVVSVSSSSHRK